MPHQTPDSDSRQAWPELAVVQRWFQAVATHPNGVDAGLDSEEASRLIPSTPGDFEQVVTRSRLVSARDRLSIYANAYYTRLLECLGDCFPVLKRTLGEEAFNALAFGYLQDYPSQSYTLGRLGERFVEYLAKTRPDADHWTGQSREPIVGWPDFLIDLAMMEWTIAEVFDGRGMEGAPSNYGEKLLSISPDEWPTLHISLAPCLRLFSVRFPLNDYYTQVRRSAEGVRVPMPAPANSFIAVTRRDYIVRRHDLTRCQFELLASLQSGNSLEEAVERAASVSTEPDRPLASELSQWFRDWAILQFFGSIELPTNETGET